MANTDNTLNISDTWKAMSDVQLNVGDEWKSISEGYINVGDSWVQWWSSTPAGIGRGVFGGGNSSNIIDYITIASAGNATDFGDLYAGNSAQPAACANTVRGIFGAGAVTSVSNILQYITIATTSNSTDFGDLTVARAQTGGLSNTTRGIFGGGYSADYEDTMDYVTINSTGNATDFGNLSVVRTEIAACSSITRGIFGGGRNNSGESNVVDYITIDSAGNATDFGDLPAARKTLAGCSSSVRGVFGGGYIAAVTNTVEYVNIDITSNAYDFGDLTAARQGLGAASSDTRGCFAGGSSTTNIIDYITIATTGNATDFGDLTIARYYLSGLSDVHGGLTPAETAIIGYTGTGTGSTTGGDYRYMRLSKTISVPTDGVVNTIYVYANANEHATFIGYIGIYDVSTMTAIANSHKSGLNISLPLGTPGWYSYTFPDPKPILTADSSYYLGIAPVTSWNVLITYVTETNMGGRDFDTGDHNPISVYDVPNYRFSIYINYTPI